MLYSNAELLRVHNEPCFVPAATGIFVTLYDYAKLGSIFLNVRHPAAPMQRQLCAHMLPCHLVLSCRSAADAVPCLNAPSAPEQACAPLPCAERQALQQGNYAQE